MLTLLSVATAGGVTKIHLMIMHRLFCRWKPSTFHFYEKVEGFGSLKRKQVETLKFTSFCGVCPLHLPERLKINNFDGDVPVLAN